MREYTGETVGDSVQGPDNRSIKDLLVELILEVKALNYILRYETNHILRYETIRVQEETGKKE